MPQFGMHDIPMCHFEYRLRLSMHPFHLCIFEFIGCGIAQLSPNSVAQVSGFIALCSERNCVPSLSLFFSIFSMKYQEGLVYFSKREGFSKIVDVKSSNSGWHGKWMYYYGPDLELVRPCQHISEDVVDRVAKLKKFDMLTVNRFQGLDPVYTHNQLKDLKFLEEHNCKVFLLLFTV